MKLTSHRIAVLLSTAAGALCLLQNVQAGATVFTYGGRDLILYGGGDGVLLSDIFDPNAPKDPLGRKAGHRDGAYSILIGVAACHSIDTGKAISIPALLGDAPI